MLVVALASGFLTLAGDVMVQVAGVDVPGDEPALGYLTVLLPALTQLGCVLWFGRTIGEAVVRLRADRIPTRVQALVRWALGIGGWSLLSATESLLGLLGYALVLVTVISVWTTRGHRGFAYVSAGLEVQDARVPNGEAEPARAR